MPSHAALAWPDYVVIVAYLVAMLVIGAYVSRKQNSDDEYFLASRRIPWWAVGLSIMATLMSSLTYLSEPGEVWKSGIVYMAGKLLTIPLEMFVVWMFIIPFLMRFRFTSVYEYLDYRFNRAVRQVGTWLFAALTIAWMGFVVLAMSRAMAHVTGVDLGIVIATIGIVTTVYTVAGGLRAVIWTDVVQVVLMLGGALLCMGFVTAKTGSWPAAWLQATMDFHANRPGGKEVEFFSADPFERTSVLTVTASMFVWYLITHAGNQMTAQRYFATADVRSARRSFVLASLAAVGTNVLLAMAGLAILYYYTRGYGALPAGLDPTKQSDQVFPTFMVEQLPPGLAGAVLCAVLAAAMSTIDSGINSLATVLCVDRRRPDVPAGPTAAGKPGRHAAPAGQVFAAQVITLAAGLFITLAAYAMDSLTADRNIVEMMVRSFNCIAVPMGSMFLIGIFLPYVSGRAIVVAAACGLMTSIGIAYAEKFLPLFGVPMEKPISFTWVLPGSLLTMIVVSTLISIWDRPRPQQVRGLTWFTRRQLPEIDETLISEEAWRQAGKVKA